MTDDAAATPHSTPPTDCVSGPPDDPWGVPPQAPAHAATVPAWHAETPGGPRTLLLPAWHAGTVRGPAVLAALCLRCLVVLVAANLLVGGVAAVSGGVGSIATVVYIVMPVAIVAVVPIAVVGWPAGMLLAWLLRGRPREAEHVLVFAAAGALLSPLLIEVAFHPFRQLGAGPIGWVALAFAAVEGVVGAGGARWWTGRYMRRRWVRAVEPGRYVLPEPARGFDVARPDALQAPPDA